MFLRSKHTKVKGGALYYVIFVVFVLSVIVSLFLLQRGTSLKLVRQEIAYFSRVDDLNSALTLYLSDAETYQRDSSVSMVLFEDSTRRVEITRASHGLLDLITANNDYRGKELSKTLLVGKNPFDGDSIALWVPDGRQALYASGSTIINGNAVIPAKGMQRASIEGKPLKRADPVNGRISRSSTSLPALAPDILKKIRNVQEYDYLLTVSYDISRLYQASIHRPLSKEMLWYSSEGDFQISGIEVEGRFGFVTPGTILIKKDAYLKGVLVSASRIVVEDGFEGELQLFARDSMVIGKGCTLGFPSVVCLSSDQVNNLFLEVGEASILEGTLIVNQENLSSEKPFLSINDEALVVGQVYHQGTIELFGEIHGSLYCEGFYMKTKRAYYENHLLDNVIDFHKLPGMFVSLDLLQGYNDQIIDILDCQL